MAQQIKKIKIGDETYDIVVEKDWGQTATAAADYIKNKPFDTIDSDTLDVIEENNLKKLSVKEHEPKGHRHKATEIDNLPQPGDAVAWEQTVTAGTKIATITVNETSTDVFVPEVTPIQLVHWDEETE